MGRESHQSVNARKAHAAARAMRRQCEGNQNERTMQRKPNSRSDFVDDCVGARSSKEQDLQLGHVSRDVECFESLKRDDVVARSNSTLGGVPGVVRLQPLARVGPTCRERMPQCGPTDADTIRAQVASSGGEVHRVR